MRQAIPTTAEEFTRLLRKRGWVILRKSRHVIASHPAGGRLVFSSTSVDPRAEKRRVSEMLRQERGA